MQLHTHSIGLALVVSLPLLGLASCSGGGGGDGGIVDEDVTQLGRLALSSDSPDLIGSYLVLGLNDPPLTDVDCDSIEIHHMWEVSEVGGQLSLTMTALDDSDMPQGLVLDGARTGSGGFRVQGIAPGTFLECKASGIDSDGYDGVTFLDIELSLGDLFEPGCSGHVTTLHALAVPGSPSSALGLDGDWVLRTAEHFSTNDVPGFPQKNIEVPEEFSISVQELGPNVTFENGLSATHDFLGPGEPFVGGYQGSDGLLVSNIGDAENSTVILRFVATESNLIGFGQRSIEMSDPDNPPFLRAFYFSGERVNLLLSEAANAWINLLPSPVEPVAVRLRNEALGAERTLTIPRGEGRQIEVPPGPWTVEVGARERHVDLAAGEHLSVSLAGDPATEMQR